MLERSAMKVSALLFAVAMIGSLLAGFWLVPAIWVPAALAVLGIRHLLLDANLRTLWLAVLVIVVLACPVLAFEGGFFVLPPALALLLADWLHGRPAHGRRRSLGSTS